MSPATLVASPRQIGSMPVASGSRLPTRADVTGLDALEKRAHALQGSVRRQPGWLVEQQNAAVHAAAQRRLRSAPEEAAVAGGAAAQSADGGAGAARSADTARSMRLLRRAAPSMLSSNTNSRRGAWRSPSRRPSSPPRKPAACRSPLAPCSGGLLDA